ncbi:general substrate transporter [Myxozyma melibiosi]|uniref:General substrate transporter n=1 Tax=Myxozyma melibiosi TaxID=54550 RepID=A0ABR1FC76_9ASCO
MEKQDVDHVEEVHNALIEAAKAADIYDARVQQAALEGSADEHDLTVWNAIKTYRTALMWALVSSTCVIMEGYDTNLLQNFFAYPSFVTKYGEYVGVSSSVPTGYQLTAAWQTGLSQGSSCGSVIGCLISGYLVGRWGSRRAQLGALVALACFIFIVFFAPSLKALVAGEVLCGIPWGILATTAPAYASEVLPLALRVYMTSYTNMCFIIGQLISAGVLKGLSTRTDQWGYRIPFVLQWFWPLFLIPLIYLSPESPWYLVRVGKIEEAEKSLLRLQTSKSGGEDVRKTLASIIYTNNLEQRLQVGTSYRDCFKGDELRRTEIACAVFAGQTLCGLPFAYNNSYFFSQIGLGTSTTYSLTLGGTGLALLSCIVNWFVIMPNFGRRTVYVAGMGAMFVILMLIGILNVWTERYSVGMTQACLSLVWTVIFQLSAGQLGWALPAEVGSTRLRQKTICLARDSTNIAGIVGGTLEQYFMNPQAWNLKGYTGFVWGGTCFLVFVWSYYRLPETRNRTFHELDILFAEKVPARKFATTEVDAFDTNVIDDLTRKENHGP